MFSELYHSHLQKSPRNKFFVLRTYRRPSFGHTLLVAWDDHPWALLGLSGELLGRFWGIPWLISGSLGARLGASRALLDGLGALAAHLSTQLSPYLGQVGQDWPSWGQLGSNFGQIG